MLIEISKKSLNIYAERSFAIGLFNQTPHAKLVSSLPQSCHRMPCNLCCTLLEDAEAESPVHIQKVLVVKRRRLIHSYRSQIAAFYPEIILVANNHDSVPSSHQSGWGGKFGLASCVPGCRAHNATPLHPVMCMENIMATDVCSVQCGDRDLISGVCGT